jgi:two-component SAPR family response regulator
MTIETLLTDGKSTRRPVQSGFAEIFTTAAELFFQHLTASDKKVQSNRASAFITESCDNKTAPTLLHVPVNRVHSIEKSIDTFPRFLLTVKLKSVKT